MLLYEVGTACCIIIGIACCCIMGIIYYFIIGMALCWGIMFMLLMSGMACWYDSYLAPWLILSSAKVVSWM